MKSYHRLMAENIVRPAPPGSRLRGGHWPGRTRRLCHPRIVRLMLAGAALAAMALSTGAHADTVAYEFDTAPVSSQTPLSLGFVFTTNEAVKVTSLGYYDDHGDGFTTPHEVGIFDAGGSLVADVVLSAGTADPLSGHFRYGVITPVTLAAGQTYTIAATTDGPTDPWAYGTPGTTAGTIIGFAVDPAITIAPLASRFLYQSDNVLRDPTDSSFGFTVYDGPDFTIAAGGSGVPEPASWAFMLVGLGGLGAVLRGRARLASAHTTPRLCEPGS